MDQAAENGHLEIVQWLHYNRTEGCTTLAMDSAATEGYLEVVQWLHENRSEGCTTTAMDQAAAGNRFDVVKWLHENRSEGCTADAISHGAGNHFDVVKWLHENRAECSTPRAMDCACSLQEAQWLYENRPEGCSAQMVESAAQSGNFETLLFWDSVHPEWCTTRTAICAICENNPEIFQWMYAKYPERIDLNEVVDRTDWESNEYTSALLQQLRAL